MNISRVEIIDGEEYVKLDFARDMLKEEREYKDNLIKYLEDKIRELKHDIENFVPTSFCGGTDCYIEDEMRGNLNAYQNILERLKSGKYE